MQPMDFPYVSRDIMFFLKGYYGRNIIMVY